MPTSIPKEQINELAAEIAKTTVPFYTVSEGKVCQERSGVLFRLGQRYFILTCAHDLSDIYTKHGLPAFIGPMDSESTGLIRLKTWESLCLETRGMDVAVITLSNDAVEQLRVTNHFVSMAEMDLEATACPANYLVLGFPRSETTVDDERRRVNTTWAWYVTGLHRGELNPNAEYDPKAHVVLGFGKDAVDDNEMPAVPPRPLGLSGCGIWRLTKGETWDDWRPEDVKLVAIQHAYSARRGYVKGSWVRLAMQMLWYRYEALRPAMKLIFPGQG
jgi:hypothetical protein